MPVVIDFPLLPTPRTLILKLYSNLEGPVLPEFRHESGSLRGRYPSPAEPPYLRLCASSLPSSLLPLTFAQDGSCTRSRVLETLLNRCPPRRRETHSPYNGLAILKTRTQALVRFRPYLSRRPKGEKRRANISYHAENPGLTANTRRSAATPGASAFPALSSWG